MKTFSFNLALFLYFFVYPFYVNANEWHLPIEVTNNAVTSAKINEQPLAFSFSGLTTGKTYKDTISSGFSINLDSGESQTLADLPDSVGRLASIAVTINNRILVIGGYSVAKDHSEKSTPEIYEYLPHSNSYQLLTNMPVPVDDTVALIYKNRFLYLISGWFDTDNVDLVQVYDLEKDIWFNATPFPGAPVFGHAGGIVNNQFVIADGVKVVKKIKGKRVYAASNENWKGEINTSDPSKITWARMIKHPYAPHYRMAATGVVNENWILFAGGSDNPYNFNGIGYDSIPSKASQKVFAYDLTNNIWKKLMDKPSSSMDHRGLIEYKNNFFILGGMGEQQKVLSKVQRFKLEKRN